MRLRNTVSMFACLVLASGCSFLGESAVHVESGNQTTGYLTRPLMLTASSDDSVQQVAQRTCDGVKAGSVANVVFVGKVPGPGPLDIADWGKYRYDCKSMEPMAPAAVSVRVAAPAAVAPANAPALAAPPPAANVPLGEAQELHRRECQRKQGTYQICLGSCLASSGSASGVVEGECAQRCAPQVPVGCN